MAEGDSKEDASRAEAVDTNAQWGPERMAWADNARERIQSEPPSHGAQDLAADDRAHAQPADTAETGTRIQHGQDQLQSMSPTEMADADNWNPGAGINDAPTDAEIDERAEWDTEASWTGRNAQDADPVPTQSEAMSESDGSWWGGESGGDAMAESDGSWWGGESGGDAMAESDGSWWGGESEGDAMAESEGSWWGGESEGF